MRVFLLVVFSCLFVSCGRPIAGSVGVYEKIELPVLSTDLEMAMDSFYKLYPGYVIPEDWKHLDDWSERGFDFMESRIFYFGEKPREMYYVTYTELKPGYTAVGVHAVSKGIPAWDTEFDVDKEEERG